ncbi:hypothetical protein CEUSTIGMA_g4182.t1 [Chlamydomonas eustigma]|uniref:F-box domain-containing protein n=1 Tax=Chlamydomonas eustigma TaxID=1157962 RepID=A0A250X104_9CHLO|nr:hypothetical protein CEUSTIGMA_g4182.t1 [Chlamydomonas eustigma]|eukprot:GAX76735.1 hypothetical protein CEUSTIGMA_g4182.t1 [Chlamydomonas eustigma]
METTCWSSPNCWSNLPRDILVQVILQLVAEDVKIVRAICSVWRNVCDTLSWRRVRGCLRNPQLGSLPLFVHKPLRNIRVELTFNGCQNSVRIFSSSEEDVVALHAALAKLQLHVKETKHNDDLYSTRANKPAGSRTLALYFGNYAVHASIISAILSRLGVLQVWQDLELYAHALPTTWPGQCDRVGLILDGALGSHLEIQFVGMELPRVYYSSGHFKPWDAVLKRDTVSYLHNEMVSKLSKNLPNLRIVKFLELRVPFDDVPRPVTSHHLRECVTVNANTAYDPSLIINPMTDPSLSVGRVSEKDHVPRKQIFVWEVSVSSSTRLSVVAQDGLLIDGCDVIFNALSVL